MNIEHFRTFLEIAGTGNFNRAAERLNITQSTVSSRIKALEEQLDRPLFHRGRNGVTLTAAGRHFQRHALTAVRAWVQARHEVALPEGYRTMYTLGGTVSLWDRLMLHWIPLMRKRAPDAALRLQVNHSSTLMANLSDGILDLGIMYHPRSVPGLVIDKLVDEQLVLVSTTRRAVSPGNVDDYVLIDWGYDFRSEHSRWFPDMEAPAMTFENGELGLQFIVNYGGSGYLPLRMVRSYLAAKQLYRVRGAPVFQRPTYVVYPESPVDRSLSDLGLATLREVARRYVARGR